MEIEVIYEEGGDAITILHWTPNGELYKAHARGDLLLLIQRANGQDKVAAMKLIALAKGELQDDQIRSGRYRNPNHGR